MTDNQIPLIDDRPRMKTEAFEKGRMFADRGQPRESPFYDPEITAEFHRGYDLGPKKDAIADKPWGPWPRGGSAPA